MNVKKVIPICPYCKTAGSKIQKYNAKCEVCEISFFFDE